MSQKLAVAILKKTGVRVSTRKPDPSPAEFIVVSRIGGGEDEFCTRDPRYLVECLSTSEVGAEELAEKARAVWRNARDAQIVWAYCDNNLARYDDPDPKLQRFQFTCGLKLKL